MIQTAYRYDCTQSFTRLAYRFTGKERDAESGLDNFGARYFGSSMGRFMSPDFGGLFGESHPDPVPWADLENPQTLNLYAYGLNNPVTNADDDGHNVRVCDNNGQCNTISNDAYTAAQKGNNTGLNVPTLDQVGMNGNGSGQFSSTSITDSNGNSVGSATYVSNGGADYYANRTGIDQLAQTGATMSDARTYVAWYGASAVLGGAAVAAGLTAGGELTTIGIEANAPSEATMSQVQRQLARDGVKSLQKSLRSAQKLIAEHEGKIGAARSAGGYTSSMESEVQQAKALITAINRVLGNF